MPTELGTDARPTLLGRLLPFLRRWSPGLLAVYVALLAGGLGTAVASHAAFNYFAPAQSGGWILDELLSLGFGAGVAGLLKRGLLIGQAFHLAVIRIPSKAIAVEVYRNTSATDRNDYWLEGAGGSKGEVVFLRGVTWVCPRWERATHCKLRFFPMEEHDDGGAPLFWAVTVPRHLKLRGETIVVDWAVIDQLPMVTDRMVVRGAMGFQALLF